MSNKRLTGILLFFMIPVYLSSTILDRDYGVRTKGLGYAFSGLADDVNCVFYNPAGLGQFRKGEIYLTYNNYFNLDLVDNFLISVASPEIAEGTFAFTYNRMGVGEDVNFMHDFSTSCYCFSYGLEVIPLLYAGANLKYVLVDYEYDASAIAYDAGGLIRIFDNHFSIGVFLENINKPTIRWQSGTDEEITPAVRAGFAFRPNNELVCSLDIDDVQSEKFNLHGGCEIWLFKRLLAPRIGLISRRNDGFSFNGGLSVRYKTIRIDYALEHHYELGYDHVFGILVKW